MANQDSFDSETHSGTSIETQRVAHSDSFSTHYRLQRDPDEEAKDTVTATPKGANPENEIGLYHGLCRSRHFGVGPEISFERLKKLSGAVRTIIECIGEDPAREGLRETPERYAKAILFFTKGYEEDARDLVNGAIFDEKNDNMVIVQNIDIFSLCEHHMVPFTGQIHIGYVPDHRILGLSKIVRLAEMFARRLQVQERLTKQVAETISDVLKPRGVGVVMESSHLCMEMRGIQKAGSTTTTSCMLGCMSSSREMREQFLMHLQRK